MKLYFFTHKWFSRSRECRHYSYLPICCQVPWMSSLLLPGHLSAGPVNFVITPTWPSDAGSRECRHYSYLAICRQVPWMSSLRLPGNQRLGPCSQYAVSHFLPRKKVEIIHVMSIKLKTHSKTKGGWIMKLIFNYRSRINNLYTVCTIWFRKS